VKFVKKLNNHFCSVHVKLAKSLSSGSNNDFIKYLPFPNKYSMFCSPVTPDEIIRILYKLPNNKAPGGDGINSKVLKVIGSSIATPLAHIFDLSFTSGEVPELLKVAIVIPIYKKGERNQPGNYRPISLLGVFDKIMEKLMYKQLSDFLENNKILYEYQFGFRKNYSTSQHVMEVVDSIYQQQQQPFNGRLSRTTWVGRYQKKHSPAHTHPGQRTSFITFLHLQRSMASSLFSLRA